MDTRPLWLSLALVAFGCGSAPDSAEVPEVMQEPETTEVAEVREMDVDNVAKRLADGEDIFLLDVRRPDEIAEHGAIEGYVNIPIEELESRLSEVPRDKPVVTY